MTRKKSLPIHSRQVAHFREARGLTMYALHKLTGVGQSTLARIEAGFEPRLPTLAKIAEALGVRLRDLVDPD